MNQNHKSYNNIYILFLVLLLLNDYLINEFYKLTNVPILLNTSFNENEPIVNIPEHALDCYLRTSMDVLVLENCLITRN